MWYFYLWIAVTIPRLLYCLFSVMNPRTFWMGKWSFQFFLLWVWGIFSGLSSFHLQLKSDKSKECLKEPTGSHQGDFDTFYFSTLSTYAFDHPLMHDIHTWSMINFTIIMFIIYFREFGSLLYFWTLLLFLSFFLYYSV